jgi:hypothetical protein
MGVIGPESVLLLFVLSVITSGTQTDLVSLVEPADYFASRRVEANARTMLELASGGPTEARDRFRQLLAIRWLGENKDRLGEHQEAVRRAMGRLADSADEFVQDRARLALARLDGKPAPRLHAAPKDNLREALAWFPEDVSLAGAIDARGPPGERPVADADTIRQVERLRAQLLKLFPAAAREELYSMGEAVGNWRMDRLAVGVTPDVDTEGNARIFLRATGRMDHGRLAVYLREKFGASATFIEKKGLRGEAITIVAPAESPPAFALVGDSEVLIAGYTDKMVTCVRVVEEMLAVRAGSRPSCLTAPLGKSLRDVPARAWGVLRGTVPRGLVATIARSPIGTAPREAAIDLLAPAAGGAGFDLHFRGTCDSEADARQSVEGTQKEVRQVVAALKELPLAAQLLGVATIRKAVEEIEIKADGRVLTVKATVSAGTLRTLLGMLEPLLASGPPGAGARYAE